MIAPADVKLNRMRPERGARSAAPTAGADAMTIAAERSTTTIRAPLNYIVDTGTPPVMYVDWPEMADKANPPQYRLQEMPIRDGRPLRDNFELDIHGFAFVTHNTAMTDFTDPEERKRVYEPEVETLIKQTASASEVVVFDHTIRIGDEQTRSSANARGPVKSVHNDYTEDSAPRRLRDILGDAEAERRMRRRWAIIQVWRPIRRRVVTDPMAICDARSIPHEGFILLQRRYQFRTAEVYYITHNPAHVWYYFPHMERNEALVFKVFDSDASKTARFTAHTAFDDPTSPPDAWPRESIETRTFAFFD
jgi:hypothetical protein